jgi:hypothetical protein
MKSGLSFKMGTNNKTDQLRNIFKRLRNKVHSFMKSAKRRCTEHHLNPKLPTEKLWENMESMGICEMQEGKYYHPNLS